MSLLVTGSIGIDTVETPFGKKDDVVEMLTNASKSRKGIGVSGEVHSHSPLSIHAMRTSWLGSPTLRVLLQIPGSGGERSDELLAREGATRRVHVRAEDYSANPPTY